MKDEYPEKTIECSDYQNEHGKVWVQARRHMLTGEMVVVLSVSDGDDDNAVIYPTIEQAQELVMNLLKAIHEAKHGVDDE